MVEGPVSTLTPAAPVESDIRPSVPDTRSAAAADRLAILDSIAQKGSQSEEGEEPPAAKALLSGLLWFGYATAILVALALIWSTASSLLKASR